MYMKLDEEVERLLCCSLCKSDLVRYADCFICEACGLRFPGRAVETEAKSSELVFDFRILHPPYCVPEGLLAWNDAQSEFEQYHERSVKRDSLQEYLSEIDSVREIYTVEYHIEGKVLDVGGHQGRLRHYLGTSVSLYVSTDPYAHVFSNLDIQPNLLRAYPSLSEPCNFLSASAEYLPFRSGSFDWIHMRSVVDHFADPYLAFLEAYRCAKVGGKLLVGLAILEKKLELDTRLAGNLGHRAPRRASLPRRVAQKLKQDGLLGLVQAISKKWCSLGTLDRRAHHVDDHMFRLTHGTLMDLFAKTGWDVVNEHWQKPPFEFCIYACGQKGEPPPLAQRSTALDEDAAALNPHR